MEDRAGAANRTSDVVGSNSFLDRESLRHPIYWLLCGAMFALPLGTSPITILAICILLAWIFTGEFIRRRRTFLAQPWFWPLVAWVILIWAGLLYTPDIHEMGFQYATKTYYWLYALAVVSVSFSKRPLSTPIKAFLVGLFINSLVGYLQWGNVFPENAKFGRYGNTGLYGGNNTLSVLLNLGIMISSFFYKTSEWKRDRIIYGFLMLFYFIHLLILGGRGGYLVFAVLSPIVLYNILPMRSVLIIVLSYLLLIGMVFSSSVVRERFAETVTEFREHFSAAADEKSGEKYSEHLDRIYMWHWAIQLFKEHPIIGVGTGGYQQATITKGGDRSVAHPHNNLLYVAATHGLVGLVVFLWFFGVLFKTGWRHRQDAAGFFVLCSSLVIFVGGFTDTHILNTGTGILLAVTTGLSSSVGGCPGDMKDGRKEIS